MKQKLISSFEQTLIFFSSNMSDFFFLRLFMPPDSSRWTIKALTSPQWHVKDPGHSAVSASGRFLTRILKVAQLSCCCTSSRGKQPEFHLESCD